MQTLEPVAAAVDVADRVHPAALRQPTGRADECEAVRRRGSTAWTGPRPNGRGIQRGANPGTPEGAPHDRPRTLPLAPGKRGGSSRSVDESPPLRFSWRV